ncbi:MAG: S9 family peptidase [Prevotella sp.]|nr:S9 family peptidase [Prevotella sp.]
MVSAAIMMLPVLGTSTCLAQGTVEDYNRAYSLQSRFSTKNVYHWAQNIQWVDSTHVFHYSIQTPEGQRFILRDLDQNSKQEFASEKELNEALSAFRSPQPERQRRFGNRPNGWGGRGTTPFRQQQRHWMEVDEEQEQRLATSPDGKLEAWVEGYNIVVHEVGRPYSEKRQISQDGTIGNYYSNRIYWSPDSRKLFVCKRQPVEKRYAYYVESSPQDQLQPILHKQEYAKPGDELPQRTPYIFTLTVDSSNASGHKTILAERKDAGEGALPNQYDLEWFQWTPDSRYVTMEYNQRGHHLYQLLAMDAETGSLTPLIEERSEKFVNYNRLWRRWLKDGRLLWISERDNWNHLYIYSPAAVSKKRKASKSKTLNIQEASPASLRFPLSCKQITSGSWCVREVLHVDEESQVIYFTASGYHANEDPYNIHYFTVRFDGTDFQELTPEEGNHRASFSRDHQYLVDTYSSPDKAPVTKLYALGSTSNGQAGDGLLLESADIQPLLAEGWRAPEVFVAPGRDGKTPMWGVIQRPTNFDPSKKYPVIEYIYAGPGDAYTPKSFSVFNWNMTPLAELGFIVVQLDGMGTSWRGKEFEEVCYKNLKDAGFPDRKAWIRAAAEKYPYMDADNVGIFGASAGGQESTTAVLLHGDFYKAAYSSCGCHDNRMDKIWWNEQWMSYPIDSSYVECSNVYHASKLERPLMLVVGELDDNVDPASTMQVADALIRAGKDFELVVLPGVHHTMGERYGEHKRYDFFVRHLLGVEPPKWSEVKTK